MSDIELTTKQRNKIIRCVKGLNDVLAELQKENPDNYINWYIEDSDNLNLMKDMPHDESCIAKPQNTIELFNLDCSSGGGW